MVTLPQTSRCENIVVLPITPNTSFLLLFSLYLFSNKFCPIALIKLPPINVLDATYCDPPR